MKHGHVKGTKRERQPRKSTTAKLEAMGAAIAAQLAATPVHQLLNWKA